MTRDPGTRDEGYEKAGDPKKRTTSRGGAEPGSSGGSNEWWNYQPGGSRYTPQKGAGLNGRGDWNRRPVSGEKVPEMVRDKYPHGGYPPPRQDPGFPPEKHREEDGFSRFMDVVGLKGRRLWFLIPFFVLLIVFLAVYFIGRPYVVKGSSMEPTLKEGNRVFVIKYRFNTFPKRDHVVVLKGVPQTSEMLIKRVVAVGGDSVRVDQGKLVVNGKYEHKSKNNQVRSGYEQKVPDDCVFVMGDNEEFSCDSRTFGPVPVEDVVGRAFFIFWPPGELKIL